jgi:hypothetical protein
VALFLYAFLLMVFVLPCYALFRNRRFRTGFKIPGIAFFFETDQNDNSNCTKSIAEAGVGDVLALAEAKIKPSVETGSTGTTGAALPAPTARQ